MTPGHPFPLHNFMHSFTRLPAVFSSFPRGTFLLSVSHRYLALDGVYHPIGAAFPNNPTLRGHSVKGFARPTGLSPSTAIFSKMLRPRATQELPLQTTIHQQAGDFHTGPIPFRSPLLGESRLVSFPPLIDMLKFSGWPCLNSGRESVDALPPTHATREPWGGYAAHRLPAHRSPCPRTEPTLLASTTENLILLQWWGAHREQCGGRVPKRRCQTMRARW